MKLTPEEKTARARQRMIEKAREYTLGTYCAKFVASVFQKMIRAEAGARPDGITRAVVDGVVCGIARFVGECVCVTCGKVRPWTTTGGDMQTGHFLGSRRNSILFEESGVAPQCSKCNGYRDGAPQEYRQWMLSVRGKETVERLEALKHTVRQFTREELVDMRIKYTARLKAAIEKMGG